MDGRPPQGDEWSRVPPIRGRELGSVSDLTWRRSYVPADREMLRVPRTRPQFEAGRRDARVVPVPPATGPLGRIVLLLSGALLILGVACGQWLLHPEYAASIVPPRLMVSPSSADRMSAEPNVASKSDRLAASAAPPATVPPASTLDPAIGRSPAAAIARAWRDLAPDLEAALSRVVATVPALDVMRRRSSPVAQGRTKLIEFETAPFPYEGRSYSDARVLLHVPPGFDPGRPGVMIVFFHGHGATLARDVLERQQVAAQVSASGVNAVLVAPQLAVDARDSSPGKLSEPGAFKRFVGEAAGRLADLYGDRRAEQALVRMPIVIVAYSGGYLSAAMSLERGGLKGQVRGVVLLDGLYGELDKFADWIAGNRSAFFASAYTPHIKRHNDELERLLSERQIAFATAHEPRESPGSVTFVPTGDTSHRDFVTHAWADYPIKDLLAGLREYRL
jgi:hypothetical protein